jgi:hypothetical protein
MALTGKSSYADENENIKKKASQPTEYASGSEYHLPCTSNGTNLTATTDLQANTMIGDANQGNDAGVNEILMNRNTNEIHVPAGPIQYTTKAEVPISSPSSEEAEKVIETAEHIWNQRCRFGFNSRKSRRELKSWRDLRRYDEDEIIGLSTTRNTIRDSTEHSTSKCLGVVPLLYDTDAEPSQRSRIVVNQLLGTPRAEDTVSISKSPSEFALRVPEWLQRVPAVAHNGIGATQVTGMARQPLDLASDLKRSVLQSGKGTSLGLDEPNFNGVVGSGLRIGSYTHTSGPTRPFPRFPSPAVGNDNASPRGPRTAPNRIETNRDQPANGLNPSHRPFNQTVTQTTSTSRNTFPMKLRPNQLFPFPSYIGDERTEVYNATPSVPSTIRPANDLTALFTDQHNQIEYEITGYRRSDPTVLWADSIPSLFASPENRYPASRLLGNGFLSTLSFDSPSSVEISFVEANTPSTLPDKLLEYLNEKKERIRLHAEGDAWRARHAAEVVRRHEEWVFARRAEEGDWGLKEWHMSGEYHGLPSCGKGRGGGFGGRGGRGWGRGGRGRGRGGMGQGV